MMAVLSLIALCAACLSSLMLLAAFLASRRAGRSACSEPEADPPQITVIIAAHNEAGNVGALIGALAQQDYPRERLHVILVDDRSDDGTAAAARAQAASRGLPLTVLRRESISDGVSPKKAALDAGIRSATSELLLFTDADCRPAPRWVACMAAALGRADCALGVSPVALTGDSSAAPGMSSDPPGFSNAAGPASTAARYAAYETARTAMFYTGAAALGLPYMSVGRNWGYRKSLYIDNGGYEALYSELGGDDDLLLQEFTRRGASVAVVASPEALCPTRAPANWRQLAHAKLRHYSVSSRYRPLPKLLLGFLSAASLCCYVLYPVAVITAPTMRTVLIAALMAVKLFFDAALVRGSAARWAPDAVPRCSLGTAALGELFHAVFSVITGAAGLLRKPRW